MANNPNNKKWAGDKAHKIPWYARKRKQGYQGYKKPTFWQQVFRNKIVIALLFPIIAIIVGILLTRHWDDSDKSKKYRVRVEDTKKTQRINPKKALETYEEMEKSLPSDPKLYALIKWYEGQCYYYLGKDNRKEEELEKAIVAYQAASKIYTKDEYSTKYAMIQNHLGLAYTEMSLIKNKEINLSIAITFYETALEIIKDLNYHDEVKSNLEKARGMLK
jgi:tetratricopeptide (TPR) repeat protein